MATATAMNGSFHWKKVRPMIRAVQYLQSSLRQSRSRGPPVRPTVPREKPEHAVYLDEVWGYCHDRPDVYASVVSLYNKCRYTLKLNPDVVQELASVLSGFPTDLLTGFTSVLEGKETFELDEDFVKTRIIVITDWNGSPKAWRASFGLSTHERQDKTLEARIRTEIQGLLISALTKKQHEEAVTTLQRCDARYTLIEMQKLLDNIDNSWKQFVHLAHTEHSKTIGDSQRTRLHRLLIKLALSSDELPPSLYLDPGAVTGVSSHSLSGGSFGDIYSGVYIHKKVAIKRFKAYADLTENDLRNLKEILYKEALIWVNLHHRYIMHLHGVADIFQVNQIHQLSPCIVMPWAERGNIRQCINDRMPEEVLMNTWLLQIAQGLAHLHLNNIVHGDLRGVNILIDSSLTVKLTDFGLSLIVRSASSSSALPEGGTVRWMAPELLKYSVDPSANVSDFEAQLAPMVDIYAFACTCVELYSHQDPQFANVPAKGHNVTTLVSDAVREGKRPMRPQGSMPESVWFLVQDCWIQKPEARPSTEDVVHRLRSIFASSVDGTSESWTSSALLRRSWQDDTHASDASSSTQY